MPPSHYGWLLPSGNLLSGAARQAGLGTAATETPAVANVGSVYEADWNGNILLEWRNGAIHHDFCCNGSNEVEKIELSERIDDLLQLSRLSRLEMRYETVDLSAIADETAKELRKGDPEREVEIAIAPGLTGHGGPHLAGFSSRLVRPWRRISARVPREKQHDSDESPA